MPVIKAFFINSQQWIHNNGFTNPRFTARPTPSFRLRSYRDQAVSPARTVAPEKQRRQEHAAGKHKHADRERISQLSGRLPFPGKEPGSNRRGNPQCRRDLPDLDLPEPVLLKQTLQGDGRKMRDVKRDMPVNPPPAEYRTQPALAVGTADPHLASAIQQAAYREQHGFRVECVFEDVREHGNIVESGRNEIVEKLGENAESSGAGHLGCDLVQLEAFRLEAVAGIVFQSAAFIAANVEQAPAARAGMKR